MTYLIVMTRVCLNPIFLKKLLAWRVLFRMGVQRCQSLQAFTWQIGSPGMRTPTVRRALE